MHLILASESDAPAAWAFSKLRAAGLAIDLVTSLSLATAGRWSQRLGGSKDTWTLELADGRRFDSANVCGVLNRLVTAPAHLARRAVPEDREYAEAEWTAFCLGWLHGLPNVINTPAPQGLCGAWRHASEWAMLAAEAGLAFPEFRQSSEDPEHDGYGGAVSRSATTSGVIVLRDRCYGAQVRDEIAAGCKRLAALTGSDLLGVEHTGFDDDECRVVHVTPLPDLTLGGDALIHGLAEALRGRQA